MCRPKLLHPVKIHLEGSDMAEQHLVSILVYGVSQRWNSELLKLWITHDGFWVQVVTLGRKEKVQDLQSIR